MTGRVGKPATSPSAAAPAAASTTLPTLRGRLAQALLAVALVWSVAAAAAVWLVVRHEVDDVLDHALQESAEILYGVLAQPAAAALLDQRPGGSLPAPPHHESLVWQVLTDQGQLLLQSHGAPAKAWLPQPQPGLADAGPDWRVYAMALPGPEPRLLVVAQPTQDRHAARLGAAQLGALAALVVGLAGAAWLRQRLRRELQPLAELSQAVASFDPLRGHTTLPPARRAELLPMRQALIALGERVGQRLASERAFSAHAAHALRTPLAGIDAQLAVAVRDSAPPLQARLQRVREAAQRLQQVVVALLALFRSGAEPQWQRVRLDTLVQRLPVPHLAVQCSGLDEIDADPDLLAAALANLLDNAARHGASQAQLHTSRQPGQVLLQLSDNGSGLPADQHARLADALDSGRYGPPIGLGLMLADLVARAHGGRLTLPAAASANSATQSTTPSTAQSTAQSTTPSGCTVTLTLGAAAA